MELSIKQIRARGDGEEIVLSVVLEDEEHQDCRELVLSVEQYAELSPSRGRITEEYFDRLEQASFLTAAVRKGESILSYGLHSRRSLVRKLRLRGFSAEQSAAAAEYLESRHYLNDAANAVREAEHAIAKLWGRRRVLAFLRSKGYDPDATEALEELFAGTDFIENCQTLIRKRWGGVPTEQTERRKLTLSLLRYGYEMSEIRAAMLALGEEN